MNEFHVALVTSWGQKGGIADYSERFTAALRGKGVEVTPIPIERPNTANPRLFNQFLNRIPSNVDVIHIQFEAGLFGRFGMSGVCAPSFFRKISSMNSPVVTTLHEVHRSHPHQNLLGDCLLRARDLLIERFILRTSEEVVVHTETARDILTDRHGYSSRLIQMHHPVEVNTTQMDQAVARSELGFSEPLLLTFGWVEQKKRYKQVVEVLPELPAVQYLIAGEPRDETDTVALERAFDRARQLGVADRVHHLGFIHDVELPILFNAVDVVVLPYERVSQSGALNLALGYGRPVLTTNLEPFEELTAEFGCPATYEDADELVEKLSALLSDSDEWNRLSKRAAAYANELTWDRFAKKSVDLYRRVCDAD